MDQPDYYRNGYCSPTCPCDGGEGDCDRDTDCKPGFRCSDDSTACRLGYLPGWANHECCEVDNSTNTAANAAVTANTTGTGIAGLFQILAQKQWDTARQCGMGAGAGDNGLIVSNGGTATFFAMWFVTCVVCMIVTYIEKRKMHKSAINEADVSFAPKPLVNGHEMRFIDMVGEATKPLHYRWADRVNELLGGQAPNEAVDPNETFDILDMDSDDEDDPLKSLYEATGDNSADLVDTSSVGWCSLDCLTDIGLGYMAFQDGLLDLWFVWSHLLRDNGDGVATGVCGVLILLGSTIIQLLQINHGSEHSEKELKEDEHADALRVAERVEEARGKFLRLLDAPSPSAETHEAQEVIAVPQGTGKHAASSAAKHAPGVEATFHPGRSEGGAAATDHVMLRGSKGHVAAARNAVLATCHEAHVNNGHFRTLKHAARKIGYMDAIVTPLQVRVAQESLTAWVRLRRLARYHPSKAKDVHPTVASVVSTGISIMISAKDLSSIEVGDYVTGPNVPQHAKVANVVGDARNQIRTIKLDCSITQTIVPDTLSIDFGEIIVVEDKSHLPENELLVDKVHHSVLGLAQDHPRLDRHSSVSRELRTTKWWKGYVEGRPETSAFFPSACVEPFESDGDDGKERVLVSVAYASTGPTTLDFWSRHGPLVVDTTVFDHEHAEVQRATMIHGTVEALLQAVLQWHAVWSNSLEDDCRMVVTSVSFVTYYDISFFSSLSSTVLAAFGVTKPFFKSLSVPSSVALLVSVEAQVLARMIVLSTVTSFFRLGLFSWWGAVLMLTLFLASFATTTWLIEHGRAHGDYYGGATTVHERLNILRRAVKAQRYTRLESQCVVSPLFGVAADAFSAHTRLFIVALLNMFQATDCDLRNPPFSHGAVKVLLARIVETVAVMIVLVVCATERRIASDTSSPMQDLEVVEANGRMVRNVAAAMFLNILAFVLLAAGATYERLDRSINSAREKGKRRLKITIIWYVS